ncbi:MAG TPA: FkbM family methyltransferase [Candidatus Acidoferrum sp.]|nr:FkbM family methyltransferase [Candidatus Acidoferrum sp.]
MREPSAALVARIRGFLRKPAKEKFETFTFRLWNLLPKPKTTIRLPFGAKWVLEESALDAQLQSGTFESAETRFVEKLLRPGMTVLDIGAHHGYYTLLASMLVGSQGRVVAFEPSPRECIRLKTHVRINTCTNVVIEETALGAAAGQADLFLVEGAEDYCNSLRPPVVDAQTRKICVPIETLDQFLIRARVTNVDFIKLDVEGAELDVLRGASHLLNHPGRPVFMIEVYDVRTRPWGYLSREIVQFLACHKYNWFSLEEKGNPVLINSSKVSFDANLVAVPFERMETFDQTYG